MPRKGFTVTEAVFTLAFITILILTAITLVVCFSSTPKATPSRENFHIEESRQMSGEGRLTPPSLSSTEKFTDSALHKEPQAKEESLTPPDPFRKLKVVFPTFQANHPDLLGLSEALEELASKARIGQSTKVATEGIEMVVGEIGFEGSTIRGRYDISILQNGGHGYAVRVQVPDEREGRGNQHSVEFFFVENEKGLTSEFSASVQYFPGGGSDPREIFPSDGDYILGYHVWFCSDVTKVEATKVLYRNEKVFEVINSTGVENAVDYTPTIRDLHSYQLWLNIMRERVSR